MLEPGIYRQKSLSDRGSSINHIAPDISDAPQKMRRQAQFMAQPIHAPQGAIHAREGNSLG